MMLVYLFLAHLLYDFHWQGDFVGIYKAKYKTIMFVHCVTWALLLCVIMNMYRPLGLISEVTAFMFLFATHWVIDTWKCKQPNNKKLGSALIIDQSLHIITIILVYLHRL